MSIHDLIALATAADSQPPVSEQALIELARGEREAIGDDRAVAVVRRDIREVELVVAPEARGAGLATALVGRLLDDVGPFEAWAHGDHPASRRLAESFDFARVRTLLQLRAPVPTPADGTASHGMPDGVRRFADGDEDAWVRLNAAAFAGHPEQGSLARRDLDDRMRESWFSPDSLLVVDGDDGLDAYAWVKPDGDVAELYAIGVSPTAQGRGLGRTLLDASFERMRELGAGTAHLYVEGDNEQALPLYRSAGFVDWAVDVRWRHRLFTVH